MEMEVTNLGLSGDNQPVKELLDSYANNTNMRQELIEAQLTTNPFDPEIEFSENKDSNNNLKILNSFLASLGIEIINNNNESNISHMYNSEYKPENINEDDYDYQSFIKSKLFEETNTKEDDTLIDRNNSGEFDDDIENDDIDLPENFEVEEEDLE